MSKRVFLYPALLICLAFCITSNLSAQTYIDTLLTDMMATSHLPGLAAMIIKDGEVIFENYYGFADIDDNKPITDSTLFMIASISKTFGGTALMQQWENGAFDLDDNVNDYLDFEVRNPWHLMDPITFRQLLTHTSSIKGDFHPEGINIPPQVWGYDHPMTIGEFCEEHFQPGGDWYADNNYLEDAPGTEFDYSSVATTLIAHLVEVFSGQTYEEYCQQHIFEPLGMNNSSWFLANIDTELLASHYMWENNQHVEYPPRGIAIYPCGWLKTSLRQLGNYLTAYMQNGTFEGYDLLQPETVEMMHTVQFPEMPVYFPGMKWGLMWVRYLRSGRTLWGHEGGSIGVSTLMYFDKEENSGVILLSNGTNNTCLPGICSHLFDYALEFTNINEEKSIAEKQDLHPSNYPNPFNPTTTISFELPRQAEVTLSIYNVKGQLVTKLLNGETRESGSHSVLWNGTNSYGLSVGSGIYYYKLQAGNAEQVEKMVLMK